MILTRTHSVCEFSVFLDIEKRPNDIKKKIDHSQTNFQLWQFLQQQALRKSFFLTLWKENIMTMSRIINVLFLKNSNYFWLILRNNRCNKVVASCNTSFWLYKEVRQNASWLIFLLWSNLQRNLGRVHFKFSRQINLFLK